MRVRIRQLTILYSVLVALVVLDATAAGAKAGADQDPGRDGHRAPAGRQDVAPVAPPSKAEGTWVAKVLVRTRAYRRPGGGRVAATVSTATPWSGSAQYLMVLKSAMHQGRQWLLLRLPGRPNNSRGWVLRDRVALSHSPYYLEISLSRRRLSVYKRGRRVTAIRSVIGHPRTPTPLGLFAILEHVRQPDPKAFLGPWAIHLTAHSEVLRRFDGGPGRIAIHGRGGESYRDPLGSARSNGCIRINNGPVRRLVRILPGTAVNVVR